MAGEIKGKCKPTAIAKELNIKPQMIYAWIKSGKIKTYTVNGFDKMVEANDARALANKNAKSGTTRGPKSSFAPKNLRSKRTDGTWVSEGFVPPLDRGRIVSHSNPGQKRIFLSQVRSEDDYLTYLKSIAGIKEPNTVDSPFNDLLTIQNTSLTYYLQHGLVKIESLNSIINGVLYALETNAPKEEVRDFLLWMKKYKHPVKAAKGTQERELHEDILEDIKALSETTFNWEEVENAPWIAEEEEVLEADQKGELVYDMELELMILEEQEKSNAVERSKESARDD